MQAIKNDINKRVEYLNQYYKINTKRIATIELLSDIADNIDFMQNQVKHAYKSIEWYNNQFGMVATTKQKYDNWQIKKAVLTRLQNRYKLTLELLNQTV